MLRTLDPDKKLLPVEYPLREMLGIYGTRVAILLAVAIGTIAAFMLFVFVVKYPIEAGIIALLIMSILHLKNDRDQKEMLRKVSEELLGNVSQPTTEDIWPRISNNRIQQMLQGFHLETDRLRQEQKRAYLKLKEAANAEASVDTVRQIEEYMQESISRQEAWARAMLEDTTLRRMYDELKLAENILKRSEQAEALDTERESVSPDDDSVAPPKND